MRLVLLLLKFLLWIVSFLSSTQQGSHFPIVVGWFKELVQTKELLRLRSMVDSTPPIQGTERVHYLVLCSFRILA
jgi:hypothetical protein